MKDKIAYLEILRIICAVVVVLDHICIAGIHIFDEKATMFDKFFYNGVQHWSHFAVPVFLMITGCLLLEPTRKIGYEKAITKYAWRMVVILLTVGTAFAWLEVYFKTKSFSPSGLFIAFCNTLQGETWKHLWYLYTLVGLYLIIPVIKPIFERMDTKELDIFLLLAFFFSSILPTFTSLTNLKFGVTFPINSIFLFYLMVGRRIGMKDKDIVKGQKLKILIVVLWVLFLILFICAYYEYFKGQMNIAVLSDYSSPIIVVTSCALFYIGVFY